MIQKHEEEIMNYFSNPQTNAKAERLMGKLNNFYQIILELGIWILHYSELKVILHSTSKKELTNI